MDDKAYFEFLAVTQDEGPLHFLIEVTARNQKIRNCEPKISYIFNI